MRRESRLAAAARSVGISALVILGLCVLWEVLRFLGVRFAVTWPFVVNERTMPHTWDVVGHLFEPTQATGRCSSIRSGTPRCSPRRRPLVGFALGALARLRARPSSWPTRGSLQRGPHAVHRRLPDRSRSWPSRRWSSSGSARAACRRGSRWPTISAYLTFFPVDHQHPARPALGRPAGGRADALLRRRRRGRSCGGCGCRRRCRSCSRRSRSRLPRPSSARSSASCHRPSRTDLRAPS